VFQVAHAQYRAPFYQFKKGEIRLLCGTDKLLGEGIDVPDVTAVINVCNTASEGMCRQIVGRAVRLFPDKEKATIIDIYFSNYDQFARAAESRRQVYETITDKVKHFTFSEDNIRE
jgi:superfamily II DNA or RNA helicase